jgi:hypothetical protein
MRHRRNRDCCGNSREVGSLEHDGSPTGSAARKMRATDHAILKIMATTLGNRRSRLIRRAPGAPFVASG